MFKNKIDDFLKQLQSQKIKVSKTNEQQTLTVQPAPSFNVIKPKEKKQNLPVYEINANIFNDFTIIFFINSFQLSEQKTSIIQNLIEQRKGLAPYLQLYMLNHSLKDLIQDETTFLCCGGDVKQFQIQQALQILQASELELKTIMQQKVIDSKWIQSCIESNQLIDHKQYQLFKQDNNVSEKQKIEKLETFIEEERSRNDNEWSEERIEQVKLKIEKIEYNELKILQKNRQDTRYLWDLDYQEGQEDQNIKIEIEDQNCAKIFYPSIILQKIEEKQEIKKEQEPIIIDDESDDDVIFQELKKSDENKFFEQFSPKNRKKMDLDKFACVNGGSTQSLNKQIIQEFEKLQSYYKQNNDFGRTIAYGKAISAIKTLKTEISDIKDVDKLAKIGDKMREKIRQMIDTGKIDRNQYIKNDAKEQAIESFNKIWGVGPKTAQSLYLKGMRSIQQLRENQHLLTRNQQIGLLNFEVFQERMSRDEATLIINYVVNAIHQLEDYYGAYEVTPCGSYRRLKETNGDVDILITRLDGKRDTNIFSSLIQKLSDEKFLVDHLTHSWQNSNASSDQRDTYMGVCRVIEKNRRIDIKIYPREQYGTAILYFTGSDYFNRSMRYLATQKGYSLSDRALTKVKRDTKRQKIWEGAVIVCYNEKDVFKELGIPYKEPWERSI